MPESNGKVPIAANDENRQELSAELAMGGQALIEGVMMRSPKRIAMAARKPDGQIAVRVYEYLALGKRIKWLGWPVIRGAVGMLEALKIGTDALNWSAQQQIVGDDTPPDSPKGTPPHLPLKGGESASTGWKHKLMTAGSMVVALAFGLGLFMYFPYWMARLATGPDSGQVAFHIVAGGVRVVLLLGYLWGISLMKDIHRVFQYHGSEHKTIFAFEQKAALTAERVLAQTRFHPRCGTSFLLIVALLSILIFAVIDTVIVKYIGNYPNVFVRFLAHLPLIPVVAGLSYEFLRFSAKHVENKFIWWLIQPGLWLQRITTQEPTADMCEVAIVSLETALHGERKSPSESGVALDSTTSVPSA